MAELRINISNLSEGIHEYYFSAEPSKIGLSEQFYGLISLNAKLDKSLKQILLQVNFFVDGKFICDRCLEEFHKKVDVTYTIVYLQDSRTKDITDTKEEIQILKADTNYIDLDEDVRQFAILSVPQKLLCKDDCKGICPVCGVNKNIHECYCEDQYIDSRWDILRKLSNI